MRFMSSLRALLRTLAAVASLALALAIPSLAIPSLASAGDEVGHGSFTGASGHITTGEVSVVKTGSGYRVVLEDSFDFDGAPDPKLAFGKDGYDRSTVFSVLKANKGKQVYDLPASIDPSKFNEVWVWCETFDVPLGVAKLK